MRNKYIFKNEYLRLILLTIVSLIAGIHLLVSPQTVNQWVIRGVGLIWFLEGIHYGLELWKKYLKSKL